jgi:hypothetical protein
MIVDLVLIASVLTLIGLELWSTHPVVKVGRVLVIAFALVILAWPPDLGPAVRRALEQPGRVKIGPAGHEELASEFASGVFVMKRTAERQLRSDVVPAVALALLALVPVLRPSRRPSSSEDAPPRA